MALAGAGRRLVVPSADLLAKNMRAIQSARAPASAPHQSSASEKVSSNFFMNVGASNELESRKSHDTARFRKAPTDTTPNPVVTFFTRMFAAKKKDKSESSPPEKSVFQENLKKALPALEKAAALASRLPDPTVLFLAVVLMVLLVDRLRPHWFDSILARIAAIMMFIPLLLLALLWRKTELFAQLREGQNPLTHPVEHHLDGLEAELTEREKKLRQAEETLQKNRAQLNALRKELAKDPNAHHPNAIIMPSRKAAEMIAAGALGDGHDDEAAEKETTRKQESVKKSLEEWRVRTEETESHVEQTKESLKLMADHAATAYTKRTRELKTRTSSGTPKATNKLMNARKVLHVGRKEEESGRRTSRYSERSTASVANSSASRKRLNFFRRKRRTTENLTTTDEGPGRESTDAQMNMDTIEV